MTADPEHLRRAEAGLLSLESGFRGFLGSRKKGSGSFLPASLSCEYARELGVVMTILESEIVHEPFQTRQLIPRFLNAVSQFLGIVESQGIEALFNEGLVHNLLTLFFHDSNPIFEIMRQERSTKASPIAASPLDYFNGPGKHYLIKGVPQYPISPTLNAKYQLANLESPLYDIIHRCLVERRAECASFMFPGILQSPFACAELLRGLHPEHGIEFIESLLWRAAFCEGRAQKCLDLVLLLYTRSGPHGYRYRARIAAALQYSVLVHVPSRYDFFLKAVSTVTPPAIGSHPLKFETFAANEFDYDASFEHFHDENDNLVVTTVTGIMKKCFYNMFSDRNLPGTDPITYYDLVGERKTRSDVSEFLGISKVMLGDNLIESLVKGEYTYEEITQFCILMEISFSLTKLQKELWLCKTQLEDAFLGWSLADSQEVVEPSPGQRALHRSSKVHIKGSLILKNGAESSSSLSRQSATESLTPTVDSFSKRSLPPLRKVRSLLSLERRQGPAQALQELRSKIALRSPRFPLFRFESPRSDLSVFLENLNKSGLEHKVVPVFRLGLMLTRLWTQEVSCEPLEARSIFFNSFKLFESSFILSVRVWKHCKAENSKSDFLFVAGVVRRCVFQAVEDHHSDDISTDMALFLIEKMAVDDVGELISSQILYLRHANYTSEPFISRIEANLQMLLRENRILALLSGDWVCVDMNPRDCYFVVLSPDQKYLVYQRYFLLESDASSVDLINAELLIVPENELTEFFQTYKPDIGSSRNSTKIAVKDIKGIRLEDMIKRAPKTGFLNLQSMSQRRSKQYRRITLIGRKNNALFRFTTNTETKSFIWNDGLGILVAESTGRMSIVDRGALPESVSLETKSHYDMLLDVSMMAQFGPWKIDTGEVEFEKDDELYDRGELMKLGDFYYV